jgi:hypothetical protein
MKHWAKEITLNNGWKEHPYHQFLTNASQQEFLESQIPFFYAVEAFPRALALLISKIKKAEDRILIIDNLNEEHGSGNISLAHTETFKIFLTSLGWNQKDNIKNPWISEWIEKILGANRKAHILAAYLAGIEYAYAPISETLANHIKNLDLLCEQSHYQNHAELDWKHGEDLLTVAYLLNENNHSEEIQKSFQDGQKDFLLLYKHMMFTTEKEMKAIHDNPVSFFYTREDWKPEDEIINDLLRQKEKPQLLLVASGGEHLFNALSKEKPLSIDVMDMNPQQIALCIAKLIHIIKGEEKFPSLGTGKFEQVFDALCSSMDKNSLFNLFELNNNSRYKEKLEFVVNKLFSNKNLSIVFGENATKFTTENFAKHFFDIFYQSSYIRLNSITTDINIRNIMLGTPIPIRNIELIQKNNEIHHVEWMQGNFETIILNKKYDFIDLSNVGDWMPQYDFLDVLKKIKHHLHPNGKILTRKLLGNYSLEEKLNLARFKTEKKKDDTLFYTEVVLGISE